jgi:filamentous hemagglutinin family protein
MGGYFKTAWGLIFLILCTQSPAQIVTDGTKGTAGSIDPPQALTGPNYSIPDTFGTQVGPNLFHSFSDFNINTGESATFSSGFAGVTDNVLSRVTGANVSNIDGLVESTISGANFFFINPNGIIFGPNATLNVPAGFEASTAHYLGFDDGGEFHATDVASTNLTIGDVTFHGWSNTAPNAPLTAQDSVLQVANGESMLLGGAGLDLDGVSLTASDGQVTLLNAFIPGVIEATNSLASSVISAGANGQVFILGGEFFADDAQIGAGGLVSIQSQADISMVDSLVYSQDLGDAGDVSISTTGQLSLINSTIDASNISDPAGNAGTVDVTAAAITLTNSFLYADSLGTGPGVGAAGAITVSADTLTLDRGYIVTRVTDGAGGPIALNIDALIMSNDSGVFADARDSGTGNSGTIVIRGRSAAEAGSIEVTGSVISARTLGGGDAGSVDILANSIQLTGPGTEFSGIYADAESASTGDAGNIMVTANSISVDNQATIDATSIDGLSGTITLIVDSLSIDGGTIDAGTAGNADAGVINVTANMINLSGSGAEISTESAVTGSSGTVTLAANTLTLSDGAKITTDTEDGAGGTITLNIDALSLDDDSAISADSGGGGNAGSILIRGNTAAEVGSVDVTNSVISTGTSSTGDAGSVDILADTIQLSGPGTTFGGIYSDALTTSIGNAGSILITAKTVSVDNQATIDASGNHGMPGSVVLKVDDLSVAGDASIAAMSSGTGSAGTILIEGTASPADNVNIFGGGVVTADAEGNGNAGSVQIESNSITVAGGKISADAAGSGAAGSVTLLVSGLTIMSQGVVSASTTGGDGGNIVVNAENSVAIESGGAIRATTGGIGTGSHILIQGNADCGTDAVDISGAGSGIFAASSSLGAGAAGSGGITVTASSLSLADQASISSSTIDGAGGSVGLNIDSLAMSNNSGIETVSTGIGASGEITIAGSGVVCPGEPMSTTMMLVDSSIDSGGMIAIDPVTLDLTNSTVVSTTSDVMISEPTDVTLMNSNIVSTTGDVNITDPGVVFLNNSNIASNTGDVNIVNPASVFITDGSSVASASGTVNITTPGVLYVESGSQINPPTGNESSGETINNQANKTDNTEDVEEVTTPAQTQTVVVNTMVTNACEIGAQNSGSGQSSLTTRGPEVPSLAPGDYLLSPPPSADTDFNGTMSWTVPGVISLGPAICQAQADVY